MTRAIDTDAAHDGSHPSRAADPGALFRGEDDLAPARGVMGAVAWVALLLLIWFAVHAVTVWAS